MYTRKVGLLFGRKIPLWAKVFPELGTPLYRSSGRLQTSQLLPHILGLQVVVEYLPTLGAGDLSVEEKTLVIHVFLTHASELYRNRIRISLNERLSIDRDTRVGKYTQARCLPMGSVHV